MRANRDDEEAGPLGSSLLTCAAYVKPDPNPGGDGGHAGAERSHYGPGGIEGLVDAPDEFASESGA